MALSDKEKTALEEHYQNIDLYDPSKAPEQQTVDYSPKCTTCENADHVVGMCQGGALGMDEGGDVPQIDLGAQDDDAGGTGTFDSGIGDPDASGDAEKPLKDALANKISPPAVPASQPAPPTIVPPPSLPQASPFLPGAGLIPANAPAAPQAPPSSKLAPDEYAQLVAALSKRPSVGQSVASGAGALADGIMQGVARAGNPGFQKNITEQQQLQKQNLIEALRGKYEAGFKGKELDESVRAHNLEDTRAAAERGVQTAGQQADTARATAALKSENARAKDANALRAQEIAQTGEKAKTEAALGTLKEEKPWWSLSGTGASSASADQARKALEVQGKAPTVGSVVSHPNGKFRFIGGDPANQKSWLKIK